MLAARHAIPAVYPTRDFAEAGGLMSYGASQTEGPTNRRLWNGPLLSGQQPTSTRLPGAVASVENDPEQTNGSQFCCAAQCSIRLLTMW
jgi:hypothetical protein